NALTLDVGADSTISASLTGSGQLINNGHGTLIVSGASPAHTGTTTVTAGQLVVNADYSGSPVRLTGGILAGTGTVRDITASAGTISPAGRGTIGSLTIAGGGAVTTWNGADFEAEVTNPTASDQVVLDSGAVIDLTGATLHVRVLASAAGNVYPIIRGQSGSIRGVFNDLPDGTDFQVDGRTSRIAYTDSAVTLTDVVATSLAFVQQPPDAMVNAVLTPSLSLVVLDQFGVPLRSDNGRPVTVTLGGGAGTLHGARTVQTVQGVATF